MRVLPDADNADIWPRLAHQSRNIVFDEINHLGTRQRCLLHFVKLSVQYLDLAAHVRFRRVQTLVREGSP